MDGHLDIYSIKVDGSHKRRLTRTHANEFFPTLSPLGKVVAFVRHGNIYRMHPDGSNLREIGPGWHPSFSPDGEKIAFIGPANEVYKMKALDGSGVTKLTEQPNENAGADEPAWGESGQIAYVQCCPDEGPGGTGGDTLWKVNPNGTDQELFGGTTLDGWSPDWSPDGSKLVYTDYDESIDRSLFIINQNGTNNHVALSGTNNRDYMDAVWSPDGKRLVFVVQPDSEYPYLATVKKDGTDFHKIPNTTRASSPVWRPR
jgi:Tol biopolymer transport system component